MKKNKFKIAVTGPESSGKSSLVRELGDYYKATVVTEYAREYYKDHPFLNTREEIIHIAEGQIQAEKEAAALDAPFTFYDSDLINIKIWLNYYNYEVPKFILEHIASKPYDFSLLLYPNTRWVEDPLRKNPNDRIALYEKFEAALRDAQYHFKVVNQLNELRLQQAVKWIEADLTV